MIGIYGSSAGDMSKVVPIAHKLGKILRDYADQIIIVTGACQGLPYIVGYYSAPNKLTVSPAVNC